MPLVLDPRQPLPELPQHVTSEDGRLSARVDEDHAGVVLCYTATEDDKPPCRVDFTRGRGDDTITVRSGERAYAPGGMAYAYDAEPALGGAATYTATPIARDGTAGTRSRLALATGGTLEPGGLPEVWLTSMTDTSRTRPVLVAEMPDLDYDVDTDDAQVLGASAPVVISSVTASPTFDLTITTSSQQERRALGELLRLPDHGYNGAAPPVVLLRWEQTSYQRHDSYAAVTDVTETTPAHARAVTRQYELELTTVDRPPVARAPLRIPEHSYRLLVDTRPDYADVADRADYAALLPTMGDDVLGQ